MITPENIGPHDQLLRDGDTGAVVGLRSHRGTADLLPLQAWQSSKTYDPPLISASTQTSTTVTLAGAVLGQYAMAAFSLDTQGISLSAAVTSANTVTVVFRNGTAGDIDLGAGTLSVTVLRMPR